MFVVYKCYFTANIYLIPYLVYFVDLLAFFIFCVSFIFRGPYTPVFIVWTPSDMFVLQL